MTADMINSEEAYRLGLVNYVTTAEQLMNKCIELAQKIMQQAPLAIAGIIRAVNAYYQHDESGFQEEISEFSKCFVTKDFKEGTVAFIEKRKAQFSGN
jgi:enoyl-CoA hydratase